MASHAVTAADVAEGLRALGVRQGGIVLAHTALSRFGHVDGGALGVITGLFDAVGPSGTVVAPTLTGSRSDGPTAPPVFSRFETPCWTGTVPETFRHLPGVIRSLHPTHSVAALGPAADWLTRDHLDSATPCGVGTPYARLAAEGGQIVLFGVDLNSCTLVHGVEETAGVPYHLQAETTRVTVKDGAATRTRCVRLHVWDDTPKDFNRFADPVAHAGGLRTGRIGNAVTTVIDAEIFWSVGVSLLLADPLFLVRPAP